MQLIKFNTWSKSYDIGQEFLSYLKIQPVNEAESGDFKQMLQEIINKYRLNIALTLSFGTGLEVFIPVVKRLCENGEFKIDLTPENLVMMVVTAVTIAYLEETKEEKARKLLEDDPDISEYEIEQKDELISKLETDSKSLLEELKLKGIGNGIIKKLLLVIKSIGKLSRFIFRKSKTVIESFFDMFGYAAICIPILNSIKILISNYQWTLDNFNNNIESVILGLTSLSAKHIINWFLDLRKDKKLPVEIRHSGKYIDTKFDREEKDELIKEQ